MLAHHYTEAGCGEQAIDYWQKAGQRASERSAYYEAIGHTTVGLKLLQTLPETASRDQRELVLQIGLGTATTIVSGGAVPEAEVIYTRARILCQQLSDTEHFAASLVGLMAIL